MVDYFGAQRAVTTLMFYLKVKHYVDTQNKKDCFLTILGCCRRDMDL